MPIGGVRAGYLSGVKDAIPDSAIEYCEDGDLTPTDSDWADWAGSTGQLTNQTSTALEGERSLELTADDSQESVDIGRSSEQTKAEFLIDVYVDNQTNNTGERAAEIILQNGTTQFIEINFISGNDVRLNDAGASKTVASSWSDKTHYRCICTNIDYSNNEFDFELRNVDTDSSVGSASNVSFLNRVSGLDKIVCRTEGDDSGEVVNFIFDRLDTAV